MRFGRGVLRQPVGFDRVAPVTGLVVVERQRRRSAALMYYKLVLPLIGSPVQTKIVKMAGCEWSDQMVLAREFVVYIEVMVRLIMMRCVVVIDMCLFERRVPATAN